LFITFTIKFPETISTQQIGEFTTILKSQEKTREQKQEIAGADEQVNLVAFEEHHKNTHVQGGTHAHESEEEEDEDMHGGQRVGCQQ